MADIRRSVHIVPLSHLRFSLDSGPRSRLVTSILLNPQMRTKAYSSNQRMLRGLVVLMTYESMVEFAESAFGVAARRTFASTNRPNPRYICGMVWGQATVLLGLACFCALAFFMVHRERA